MTFVSLPRTVFRGVSLRVLIAVVVVLLVAASTGGYALSRRASFQASHFGDFSRPDRVDLVVWVTRIDTAAYALSMTVRMRPAGALADAGGNFASDATLFTSAVGSVKTTIRKGDLPPDLDQRIGMVGAVTDYPFDEYSTFVDLHVYGTDGKELPTAITVLNTDPFFRADTEEAVSPWETSAIKFTAHRSEPTRIFALFIMVLMLGLAAAAAVAAYYVLRPKRGLHFSACSMLAGMLFALIPLRNAVPGSPPVGSIIDFASFFIAEAVISISLISCVILGYRYEMDIERAAESSQPT
jgi:hypothetical protein